ncbi:MAG: InlB B-repeat-containing protein [Oscillospiraceae bacterium]|nr:InlB B-repeat-containing protein [Oscillospiraceae bacterium]
MKKVLTFALTLLLLICLCSCGGQKKKEALLDKLEGKWVGYDDGYLYYTFFRRGEEEGNMYYGDLKLMTKYGGTMEDLESTDKNTWKFKVENRAAVVDVTDIDKGLIKLSNLTKDGKEIIFERYVFDDFEFELARAMNIAGPLRFILTFDTDGGNEIPDMEVWENDRLTDLPVPQKKGYEFAYWKDAKGVDYSSPQVVTGDISLRAEYKDGRTITLDTRGGEELPGIYVKHGEPLPELPRPKKANSIFNRWTDADKNTVEEGTVLPPEIDTIYAWYFGAATLKFDSDGGGDFADMVVREGTEITGLPVPNKRGYIFICWKDKNGTPILEGSKLTEGVVQLKAEYEKMTSFAVSFDSRGGTGCTPIVVNDGDLLPALPVPSKEGYKFICWKDKNETPIYEGALLFCENITLYAYYEEIPTFTVSFNSMGGTLCDPITMQEGQKLPALPKPSWSGHVFRCWTDKNGKVIGEGALLTCEDVTLFAEWIKTFRVAFDPQGGSSCSAIIVKDGDKLPALPSPTRDGYVFRCWADKNGTPIYEGALLTCQDVTLYAQWIKTFKVSFDSQGGSSCSAITVKDGDKLPALPVTKKEGYDFVCWKDKNGVPIGEGALLTCEDVTLYAEWKIKTFTVSFDSKGGSSCSAITVNYGAQLPALPVPVRECYSFVCWKDRNDVPIGEGALLTCENITLYADWKRTAFKVTFDSTGGSACSPIIVKDGDKLPALPVPTRSGYSFNSWRDKNDMWIGEGALLTCEDITLYAYWEPLP